MRISSSEDSLGCQSVYRVLGVLDGDISFYTGSGRFGYDEFDFKAVMVGSAALAVHADRHGVAYETDTKDIDLYTIDDFTGLQAFQELPQASENSDNGSQYGYNVSASGLDPDSPSTFVDVITDFEKSFDWNSKDADHVENMLSEDLQASEPMFDNNITVYLPRLETLSESFKASGRDYSDRIELIEKLDH